MRPRVDAYQTQFALASHKYDLSGAVRPASIAAKVTLATQLAEDALRGEGYEFVHIRGCGFTGAAFALAAARLDRDVRIYTDGHLPFEPQRESPRVLDPTVYDWPASSWTMPWTQEPNGRVTLTRGALASDEVGRWAGLLRTDWFRPGPGPTVGDAQNLVVDATGPLGQARSKLCPEETYLMTGADYWGVATNGIPRDAELHIVGGGDGALQEAILLLSGYDTVREPLEKLAAQIAASACPNLRHVLNPRALVAGVTELPQLKFGGTIKIHSTRDPLAPMEYIPGRAARAFPANLVLAAWYEKAYPDRLRFYHAEAHRYEGFTIRAEGLHERDSELRVEFADRETLDCCVKHLLLRVGPESRHFWNGSRYQYSTTSPSTTSPSTTSPSTTSPSTTSPHKHEYEYQWR